MNSSIFKTQSSHPSAFSVFHYQIQGKIFNEVVAIIAEGLKSNEKQFVEKKKLNRFRSLCPGIDYCIGPITVNLEHPLLIKDQPHVFCLCCTEDFTSKVCMGLSIPPENLMFGPLGYDLSNIIFFSFTLAPMCILNHITQMGFKFAKYPEIV